MAAGPAAWLATQCGGHSALAWDPRAQKDLQRLLVHSATPLNAEPILSNLAVDWITPTGSFYVRNHGAIPQIDPASYRVSIEGLVERPLELSLAELRERFAKHSVTATMACAGNRRAEMAAQKPISGVPWQAGAVGNAVWTGVRLADVLRAAGPQADARHVWFDGRDLHDVKGHATVFGASIPMARALSDEAEGAALLVTHMNDMPLLPEHGAPLRTVVPGYIGARSVKWLQRIVVSDRPSDNHYVAHAYRLVEADSEAAWAQASILYELPLQAAFCEPASGRPKPDGMLTVRGYAHAAGSAGRTIQRVEISANEGRVWRPAELSGEARAYCWRLWKATLPAAALTGNSLLVRCVDSQGQVQPEQVPWNAKGYMQHGWQRLAFASS